MRSKDASATAAAAARGASQPRSPTGGGWGGNEQRGRWVGGGIGSRAARTLSMQGFQAASRNASRDCIRIYIYIIMPKACYCTQRARSFSRHGEGIPRSGGSTHAREVARLAHARGSALHTAVQRHSVCSGRAAHLGAGAGDAGAAADGGRGRPRGGPRHGQRHGRGRRRRERRQR